MAKKIEVQIVGDADSLHRALGKASDSTSKFGRVAMGVGKAGFLALGAGAVGAAFGIEKAVEAGSNWNETLNKSNVVFGKSSKSVQNWSETMAEASGLSQQAALDAASMFGTFGKAAGVGQKQLDNWSESLVSAAGDLASFHNVDPTQALEDIRSGLAGEVEPLRKYGILLNDATLRQQALKMGLVDTTKNALSPNNRMLAAQALILKDLGPAAGDFARTSQGLANQQRILKAELQNVVTQLGAALLPIVVKVAQFAIPLLIDAVKKVASWFQQVIHWASDMANHFEVLGGKSTSAADRIHNAWHRVVAFFRGNVMPIIRQLRDIFQEAMKRIAKVVQDNGPAIHRIFNRVGAAMKAIAQVAMPILKTALVKVLPQIIGVAIKALDKLTAVIEHIVKGIKWLGNHSPGELKAAGDAFKTFGDSVFKYLVPGLGQLLLMKDTVQWLASHIPSLPDIPGGSGLDILKGLGHTSVLGAGAQAGGIFGVGGGRSREINQKIHVYLDGKEIHASVKTNDRAYRRQNGRSAFA